MSIETDKLITALQEHGDALERNSKMQYIKFMQEQTKAEDRTPTAMQFGTFQVNSVPAVWTQLVPRNARRKSLILTMTTVGWVFALNDQAPVSVAAGVVVAGNGRNTVFAPASITVPLLLETTESIWACFPTSAGAGSIVSWAEAIYSDLSANPLIDLKPNRHNKPGDVEKLSPGLQSALGDIEANFTREGVR